ncbi:MAG: mannonate dehydratase [Pseudothermotoga sp.]
MKVVFRWYGEGFDTITLEQIRQIPYVEGVVGALFDVPVGEIWPMEKIINLKKKIENVGLKLEVIESVNVHEDIKLGLPTRDHYIENYNATIENLAKAGVKVIVYNFMPVFDWIRTDLAKKLEDGSEVMEYDHKKIEGITPSKLVEMVKTNSQGFVLAGWDWKRLKELDRLMKLYEKVDEDKLFSNLIYFLENVIPVCEKYGVKLAIHPDDPPFSVFGLPKIVTCREKIEKILRAVDSPYNGLAFCTGSLGANEENNLPEMIRYFGKMKRIHFVHLRNLKILSRGHFYESAHPSLYGSLDMFELVKALYDTGFDGYMRPDHGRTIWNERARPGYGLYDRALGITYLMGLWEAVDKMSKRYCS